MEHRFSLVFDASTFSRIEGFARERGLTMSEAVRRLVAMGLEEDVADGAREEILQRIEAVEERMAKTAARGTKAALASNIALVTYLAPLCNVTRANNSMLSEALGGYRAAGIDRDLAALAQMQGLGPEELFDFAWEAGGRLQKRGTRAGYNAAVKGLRKAASVGGYSEDPELRGAQWLHERFGDAFVEEWLDAREAVEDFEVARSAGARLGPSEAEEYEEALRTERRCAQAIAAAAESTRGEPFDSLVFDIDDPRLWREPLPGEKAYGDEPAAEALASFGLDAGKGALDGR